MKSDDLQDISSDNFFHGATHIPKPENPAKFSYNVTLFHKIFSAYSESH